jgi:hypothetical protein
MRLCGAVSNGRLQRPCRLLTLRKAPAFRGVPFGSRLYRRLFLERLQAAFAKAELVFFGNLARLMEPAAFAQYLGPLRRVEWNVYAKRPFGGPQQVLEYLGRYTHRVAIANSRLLACENGRVHFRWKDYRAQNSSKVMTLDADEFIRRFLLHVFADAVTALFDFAAGASARPVTFERMGLGGAMGQGAGRTPRCSAATRPVAGPCDGHIPRATNCRARCVVGRAQLPDALLGRACTPPGFMPIGV